MNFRKTINYKIGLSLNHTKYLYDNACFRLKINVLED